LAAALAALQSLPMFNPLRSLALSEEVDPWLAVRRAPRHSDEALNGTTRLWLRRLPAGRRPLRLCEHYPRVANLLACSWADPARRAQTLDDLLQDRRGGRRGFPACVVRELQRLRDFDGVLMGREAIGPPWWRAMVGAARR
jgi:hypothetical protein